MGPFPTATHQSGCLETFVAACFCAVIALCATSPVQAQCQPATKPAQLQSSELTSGKQQGVAAKAPAQGALPGATSAADTPQFYDEPQFSVAGVTDTTNLGGHGSDAALRTNEALARETASLSRGTPRSAQPSSTLSSAVKKEPLNPGDYNTAFERALADADAGQYEQARVNARALLAAQTAGGEKQDTQHQAELHHLLGNIEEKLAHPLEAVSEYQRAAKMNPSEAHLFDWGAELLLHRAVDPALEVFTSGNRLFPRSVRMLVALGVAWYLRGSYAQALHFVCQASDLNPADPNPYLFLGKMQSIDGAHSDSFAGMLRRFVKLQPENALANYYYAVSLWKQSEGREGAGNFTQVETLLQKAVHLDPKLAPGYLQLGVLYADRRQFPQAISAYQKAIGADPEMEEAHYRLAQIHRLTGDQRRAQQELQLYKEISTKKEEEVKRQRHEIQQFVYTMRSAAPAPRPQ